ncbi:TPA: gamma-glutamyl-gamma-aminobutyrate hydrolase family protein [Vibrio vulnificus]|nr:peptidase C26 [Vibrio vulnificus]HDY7721491.1 gamma-glutamyl-gamma-aminobutyrate hydrolase family protein [Vibrio vulnificus]HDY7748737.1 gamma-glutamyl-gamma-aminobutyrate hydrolase family protein [Vibrio vulnificus]HDY7756545.1 gamma-glutamyl-gamma-aminobutyrate hydrolase family protein [Vibrio vulnificus]HDY7760962.1 gamma-glutamyl-gamma-aminobutyrate hydrolase family protein [Vibrio vulnificus]
MKPILISQRVMLVKSHSETRDSLDQRYVSYFLKMGFIPFIAPNNEKAVTEMMKVIDFHALVLTGGNDLIEFGGNAPERDQLEKMLLFSFSKENKPILGICRGMQLIACCIAKPQMKLSQDHVGTTHIVTGWCHSRVNSYHTWIIPNICTRSFKVLATDLEGNVEAFISKDKPILGIMWHPEREESVRSKEFSAIKTFLCTGEISL